jgi:outer membrane protein assembly factor BamE (lipoprotein component of BamABCDE complex)
MIPDPRRRSAVRKKLGVVVVLLTVVTGSWFLTRPRPHRINQEGFDRITDGMTRQEVEEVLGRPPGDYTDRRDYPGEVHFPITLGWDDTTSMYSSDEWVSDQGRIVVYFDQAGMIREKQFYSVDHLSERPWTERVRRALPPLPWTR